MQVLCFQCLTTVRQTITVLVLPGTRAFSGCYIYTTYHITVAKFVEFIYLFLFFFFLAFSLVTRGAFAGSGVIQPRAIVALGVLCNSSAFVTDDLLVQVLTTLKDKLPPYVRSFMLNIATQRTYQISIGFWWFH